MNTEVLIIGAGPTGLSLACQLLRYGIDFVIVEKKEAITPYSKAIGAHARTLEIFDQIGLAARAVAQGALAQSARLLVDGKVRGELEFGDVGKGMSAFPFVTNASVTPRKSQVPPPSGIDVGILLCWVGSARAATETRDG